jgi:hypothetical protein
LDDAACAKTKTSQNKFKLKLKDVHLESSSALSDCDFQSAAEDIIVVYFIITPNPQA